MFTPAQPWCPTTYTRPLSEDFPSDGHRLLELVDRYWVDESGQRMHLDEWQRSLIIHLLERYPEDYPDAKLAGRLRWRQAVVSVSRQNGKSIIAGVLALYGLLQHSATPNVIGIAPRVEQAQIVYDRVAAVVRSHAKLTKLIKATGTRGLRFKDGRGSYRMKTGRGDALQGAPVTFGICDELHILQEDAWDSLVTGQRAQLDGFLFGITTAGDDDSKLLKRLYRQGREAAEADDPTNRFGFFCWEAPEDATLATPGAVEASTPAAACGRLDADLIRAEEAMKPEHDQVRYTLNRFASLAGSWLPMASWRACKGHGIPKDTKTNLVFSVDRTPSWEYASIVVTAKVDGKLHTELVASVENPSLERLETALLKLLKAHRNSAVVLNTHTLGTLGNKLKDRGHELWKLAPSEQSQACALAFSKIMQGAVEHNDDNLLNQQFPTPKRKNRGGGWVLEPSNSPLGIDAVLATVYGLYLAEIRKPAVAQLF